MIRFIIGGTLELLVEKRPTLGTCWCLSWIIPMEYAFLGKIIEI